MAPAGGHGVGGGESLGLTTDQKLVRFSSSAPGTLLASLPITGLPDGERIVAIEVLDREGIFLGFSSAGRLYALDRLTGAATDINPAVPAVPLTGTAFGMDDLVIVSNDGSGRNVNLEGQQPSETSRLPHLFMQWPCPGIPAALARSWTRKRTPSIARVSGRRRSN